MSNQVPLAHSPGPDGKPQLLVRHLEAVAKIAASHAAKFEAAALGHWSGLWHDVGKFHPDFQAYVRNPVQRHGPDHSSAGAALAAEVYDLLAFPIAGHHAGLPSRTALKSRLAEKQGDAAVRTALEIAARMIRDLRPTEVIATPSFLFDHRGGSHELFVRMLFSGLVDADYLDTERHFAPRRSAVRERSVSFDILWERFASNQARISGVDGSPLNRVRHEIYEQGLRVAALPPGVFSLTVPTGGGKTRSVMGFALRHALRHGLNRIIVAIPYTSIIEQTADVYRGIFGDALVLEHHSAVDPERPDDGVHPDWARLASENWDAPIIVTTTVQLFEGLFADRPSRCRRLHNITLSVVVLDEVQMLPPHLLAPILDVLKELVAHYRVTVVLCTATQPALTESPLAPRFKGFAEVREIIEDPARYFVALRRVHYERPAEAWSWEQVADVMRAERQALAVVNTKPDALALLDALADSDVLHLSTLLCGAHRRDVLREVRRRLDGAERCLLVSTQVIEAGVDLDFPLVLRAMGPLDRIVQAAGRCNREGRLDAGKVVVFDPKEGRVPGGAYRTGTDTTRSLVQTDGFDFHAPAWYERYFRMLYQARDLDEKRIQPLRAALDYPEVARRFRLIEDDTVPVVVRYRGPDGLERAADEVLAAARSTLEMPRDIFRLLQPYLVQVWEREIAAHERAGRLAQVRPGLWEWLGGYDAVRGLTGTPRDPGELVV